MKSVFMVAEKPSLAQSLALILSDHKCSSRKGATTLTYNKYTITNHVIIYLGFNGACSVHEWTGSYKGEAAYFKMTSVCGHINSLDFPAKFNNWDTVDPVELFRCPTEKKEATPKLKMPAFLASEAKGSHHAVLWLDCDKEGENICFEVAHDNLNNLFPILNMNK